MFETISNFRLLDTLDIIIIAIVIYYILSLIVGTRAVQMLFGLAAILLLYFFSQSWELYTLNWVLGHFLGSIILIVVILFQNDIRRALATLGKNPLVLKFSYGKYSEESIINEIVKAASLMASRQIGALIAIERKNSLNDFVEIGMRLDAWVSRELIISIFNPTSPLHDGGMIIGNNKILSVGSFFPLVTDPDLERDLGTRHRAAIGLSRETDSIVVVVSEERGTISIALQGNLIRNLDATSLNNLLLDLLEIKKEQTDKDGILRRIFSKKQAESTGT